MGSDYSPWDTDRAVRLATLIGGAGRKLYLKRKIGTIDRTDLPTGAGETVGCDNVRNLSKRGERLELCRSQVDC